MAAYKSCIEACLQYASICNYCASSCTDIQMMARCIQLDMECAAIYAAAQLMSLGNERAKGLCQICAAICEECGNECGQHQTDHCQQCAITCKKCAEECRAMVV